MYVFKFSLVFFNALLIHVTQAAPTDPGKIHVDVYYEALCPDSIRYFIYNLYPTYEHLGKYLDIQLIPYGKAIQNRDKDGKWHFDCQHGSAECYGNKVMACVLDQNWNFDIKMNVINCMMGSRNPSTAGKTCTEKFKVEYDSVGNCADSSFGDDLLAHYGDLTHSLNPQISFVPTIVFNGKYDRKLQNGALNNMTQTTCGLFTTKPPECPTS